MQCCLKSGMRFPCFLQCIVSNNLQDVSLLILIFFSRSPSPCTPIDPASLLFSPPQGFPIALIIADAVFPSVGRALASLAGSPAIAAPSKVSVPVPLSCRS